jgi:dTMP kinase
MTGRIIAIEGGDGAGKATQTELLVKYLSSHSERVVPFSFPNYEYNFFGKIIKDYLAGKYGGLSSIPPQIASVLYACDRFESLKELESLLSTDYTIICDRYTYSNVIYQCARVPEEERMELKRFIEYMEHYVFKLPKPVKTIYLDVPLEQTTQLLADRAIIKDIYESNDLYSQEVYKFGKYLATYLNWKVIPCMDGDSLKSKEEIHRLVVDALGA